MPAYLVTQIKIRSPAKRGGLHTKGDGLPPLTETRERLGWVRRGSHPAEGSCARDWLSLMCGQCRAYEAAQLCDARVTRSHLA